jgi:hypothetical protein
MGASENTSPIATSTGVPVSSNPARYMTTPAATSSGPTRLAGRRYHASRPDPT